MRQANPENEVPKTEEKDLRSKVLGLAGREGVPRKPGELVEMYGIHSSIRQYKVATVAVGISGKPKLLTYNLRKLVQYGGLYTCLTTGTILVLDDGVRIHMFGLLVLCTLCGGGAWATIDDLASVDISSLEDLADYMNGFVPFVLGLYVSLALARWWALRVQALGAIFDAVANTAMLVSCVLPHREHAVIRDLVVKWGLGSIFLVVKAARKQLDLSDMSAKELLSEEEVRKLEDLSSHGRAMVMWAWIMRLAQETFGEAEGPGPHAPKLCAVFNQCIYARNGIQTIHTYLHTQLPFAYVHLITLLVNVNNLIVAIKCGVVFVVALANNDVQTMIYQVLMFFLVPVLYHGLLSISYVIHDPFGDDMLDFPIAAFLEYVSECCDAVMVAQDCYPGTPHAITTDDKKHTVSKEGGHDPDAENRDPHAIGAAEAASAAAETLRDATGAIVNGLAGIGRQLKQLSEAVEASEDRRVRDAERLCGAIVNQAKSRNGAGQQSTVSVLAGRSVAEPWTEGICGKPILSEAGLPQ